MPAVILAMGLARAIAIAGSRWLHLLAGLVWIGLLYYFNFVQTPSFAKFEAPARSEAFTKLVPRALLWFRMGAAMTFVTGILILGFQPGNMKSDYFKSYAGMSIFAGMLMATVMMLNVWFVIWPNQRIVIANNEGLLAGKEADPAAAPAARRGALASRTNVFFSIPVMFFMIGTTHFVQLADRFAKIPSSGSRALWYIVVIVVTAIIELNALGKLGGYDPSPTRKFLDDHRQTIWAGFILALAYFVLLLVVSA